jgi:hypothetical protein
VGRGNDIPHSSTFRNSSPHCPTFKDSVFSKINCTVRLWHWQRFSDSVKSRIRQKGMRPCARSQLKGTGSMMIPHPPTHSPRKRRREELRCLRFVSCVSARVHVCAHVDVCASRHGLHVCARACLCVSVARKLETRPAWPGQACRSRDNGDRGRQAPCNLLCRLMRECV